jgi:DNA-binding transcriptional MocR family regulator
MSALKWARQQRLGGPASAVLRDLADRANESGVCWPSIATIAADTGYDRRTIQRALRTLEHERLIESKRTGRGSRYTLNLSHQRRHSDASDASESHIRGVTLTPKASRTQKNPTRTPPTAKAAASAYKVGAVDDLPDVTVDQAVLAELKQWTIDHRL